jgi:LysM repeat protein
VKGRGFAHYAAPIAFLAAVTIIVLIVHSALQSGPHPVQTTTQQTTTRHHPTPHQRVRFYTVRSGDTLGSIAQKTGTTVARLEHLNPKVDPNALQVGEKIRVR